VEERLAGLDVHFGKDFHISRDVEHLNTRQGQGTDRFGFGASILETMQQDGVHHIMLNLAPTSSSIRETLARVAERMF
jgi:hypothetical protein